MNSRVRLLAQFRAFHRLLIPENVIKNMGKKSIFQASPLQNSLIPLVHSHQNVVLKTQTGAGKSFSLVLGCLSKKNPKFADQNALKNLEPGYQDFLLRRLGKKKYLETIYLVPNRELALQIYNWMVELGGNDNEIQCLFAGGPTVEEHAKMLQENTPRIIIGTPTRLYDLFSKKAFDVYRLQTLIIDEVDQLVQPLSRYATVTQKYNRIVHTPVAEKLINEIINIRKPSHKRQGVGAQEDVARRRPLQIIVASATVNNPLKKLLIRNGWLKPDFQILDMSTTDLPQSIKHCAYFLDQHEILSPVSQQEVAAVDEKSQYLSKLSSDLEMSKTTVAESIASLCHKYDIKKALVFIQTKESLKPFVKELVSLGIPTEMLDTVHDYSSNGGEKPFHNFIHGNTKLVLARHYEGRGLDIPSLDYVILIGEFSPQEYTHATGRTGRFGRNGTAISLLMDEKQKSKFLSTARKTKISLS